MKINTPERIRQGYGLRTVKETHLFSDETIKTLEMRKFLGSLNKCPNCGKTGEFGSILTQMEMDGNWFLCCGWCKKITPVSKEEMKERKYD